ncbi:SRPBCC family protein [Methylocapsa palsarum]|uniref:SRPBCC family protein n=1 Tax=Methylocapsa palsarum TaxID=1612308 RepID=UPI001FCD81DB|nr:SRPBCC family protein [Methylocapsa palsarum]
MIEQRDDAPIVAARNKDTPRDAGDAVEEPSGGALAGWAVTISRPVAEIYAYWRDFKNLATFMDNVVSVSSLDSRRSHWVVKAPAGQNVEWDSVVTEDVENELIAWRSEADAQVPNSGRIEFRDAGARGTIVTAAILYDPPGGAVGKVIAKMFQREPAIQSRRDLRRFKQLMETGEIATAARTKAQREAERC